MVSSTESASGQPSASDVSLLPKTTYVYLDSDRLTAPEHRARVNALRAKFAGISDCSDVSIAPTSVTIAVPNAAAVSLANGLTDAPSRKKALVAAVFAFVEMGVMPTEEKTVKGYTIEFAAPTSSFNEYVAKAADGNAILPVQWNEHI